jgi:hypothetical protein
LLTRRSTLHAQWEKGQLGRYFVRFWGDFVNDEAVVMSDDQRYLAFALDQIRATVTTLTLNADDIIYTVNRSPIPQSSLVVPTELLLTSALSVAFAEVLAGSCRPTSRGSRAWLRMESWMWWC